MQTRSRIEVDRAAISSGALEQQLSGRNRGAAALHRELSGARLLTQANEGEVAEQAKRAKLLVI